MSINFHKLYLPYQLQILILELSSNIQSLAINKTQIEYINTNTKWGICILYAHTQAHIHADKLVLYILEYVRVRYMQYWYTFV